MSTPYLEPAPPDVKRYQRDKLIASLTNLILTLVALAVLALWGAPALRESVNQAASNRWIRLAVVGAMCGLILEILTLPISFWSGFILEHRHGLSRQTFAAWLWKQVKGWMIGAPLGLGLLFGLYSLLWRFPETWWIWATLGWLALTLLLGQLVPVVILPLFYKVTPLDDASLLERLRKLADGTGLFFKGIYRLHLSAETRKANAALAGLGRTRRVLLGDTLLDDFTPEEIEVVFAHEVGHHVYRHLPKLIAWSVATSAVGFYLVDQVLHRSAASLGYAAFNDPTALPFLLLVLTVFGLILGPMQNAISRFFERQCDAYALKRTRNAEAYCSAFIKLARLNKSDPDPNPWVVWLHYDHPPIRERLALATSVLA
ncbi:MAG: M48 family metallopeptidase [Gemmataceae bacterium]